MFLRCRPLLCLILCLPLAPTAPAFVLSGPTWPSGSEIVLHLQLTALERNHFDGSPSWNASAEDAMNAWNEHLGTVRFVRGYSTGASGRDGKNSVIFSSSIYGDRFGASVLAVTLNYSSSSTVFSETDVIFNTRKEWGTYRGPQHSNEGYYIYDLHRVALHEFGHVLGLDHPDQQGQWNAVMHSMIGDVDQLADDDIAGARHLYGNVALSAVLGSGITRQVVSRITGGTYSATNLPPGLTIDAQTGVISGIAEISGTYRVVITITGGGGSQTVTLPVTVTAPTTISAGTVLATLPVEPERFLADPVRPRMYASLARSNSVAVIDTQSFTIITTIPVGTNPFGMALSADGTRLWVANRGSTSPGISVIDLVRLEPMPGFNTPAPAFDVAEGLHGRLYASTASPSAGNIMQLDSSTGAHQNTTAAARYAPCYLQATPDRRTLFAAESGGESLFKFDITGSASVRTQSRQLASHGRDLAISPDGAHVIYPTDGGNIGFPQNSSAKIRVADIQADDGLFSLGETGAAAIFSGDGALFYQTLRTFDTRKQILIFDARTSAQVGQLQVSQSIGLPQHIALENTGRALFYVGARVSPAAEQVRVIATGRTNSATPAQPRAKSLLNVSTRLATQQGDGVLIAGFIITGDEPKKVALRGVGPSMPLSGALADPRLELRGPGGEVLATNNNWNARRAEVLASGLAPSNEYEAAIITTLPPGSYTAILQGVNGTTGVGLVELYDLTPQSNSRIANISTRGKVETNDNVMIGGFIVGRNEPTKVIVRAIGPSLSAHGVTGALVDPTLDLHDANGTRFSGNDNWRSDQSEEILASTVAPADDREAAVVATLQPGGYTAIVRGKNQTTGVALVEVYNLAPQ